MALSLISMALPEELGAVNTVPKQRAGGLLLLGDCSSIINFAA